MEISERQLLRFNKQGLIPGPSESEEEFLQRASYCLNLKDLIQEKLEKELPFSYDDKAGSAALDEALPTTLSFYDIAPDWLPLFFSNYRLPPWHGGSAWIFKTDEKAPTSAFLQLRRGFLSKKKLLGLYSREEVISHESAHVGRMLFEEPRFEELLACRSSPSSLRAELGALPETGRESSLFAFLLLLILSIDLFIIFLGPLEAFLTAMWLKLLPAAAIAAAWLRLRKRRGQLAQCLSSLNALLGDSKKASAVAYRLTDEEIALFATMNKEEIAAFAKEKSGKELRWRLIAAAYLTHG
jgi:hypothetical protein